MAIYRYTMYKYIKSPSTWIITGISMFIAGFLGGWLPFHLVSDGSMNAVETYAMTVIGVVGGITSFLAIFVSVFAGFKAASMYKDEVEDGTFLVMLSKPQTRGKIIFQKWLALQTAIVTYSFLTIITFVIAVAINDPGKDIIPADGSSLSTLTSELGLVSLTMWGILVVIGFIFTSIALLLSTRLSVGSTIGISIALGVVIPVTSMVSMFTAKPEYASAQNSRIQASESMFSAGLGQIEGQVQNFIDKNKNVMGLTGTMDPENILATIDGMVSLAQQDIYKEILGVIEGPQGLSNIGLKTGDTDAFKSSYFFDLNYQIHSLGSMASDLVIPSEYAALTSNSKWGQRTGLPMTTEVTNAHPFTEGQQEKEMLERLYINAAPLIKVGISAENMLRSSGLFKDAPKDNPVKKPELKSDVKRIIEKSGKSTEINQVIEFFNDLATKPISTVVDESQIKAYYDEAKFSYDSSEQDITDMYKDWSDKFALNPEISRDPELLAGMQEATEHMADGEKSLIKQMLSITHYDDTHNNNHFVEVKKVPYANKYYILYIYLAIAIILVPISYFVVRKQDFR